MTKLVHVSSHHVIENIRDISRHVIKLHTYDSDLPVGEAALSRLRICRYLQ